ncbi:MAG: hypothetical protein EOP83_06220, partial [Verrucomicrobiaceae bacterium]
MADSDQSMQQLLRAIDALNRNLGGYGKIVSDTARRQNRAATDQSREQAGDWQDIHDRVAKGWDAAGARVGNSSMRVASAFKGLSKDTGGAAEAFK